MNAQEKELLRHVVLEILAVRHPAALPVRAIRRQAARELDFEVAEGDVIGQCAFLVGMKFARASADPLGSTNYYAATSEGVLAWERGLKPNRPNNIE